MRFANTLKAAGVGSLAVSLAFAVSACSNPAQKVQEAATEKALETLVESSADGDVDADFGIAGSASYPEGWPAQIPVPKNAQVLTSIRTAEGASVLLMTSRAEGEATIEALRSQGWVESLAQESAGSRSYAFETPHGELVVAFMPDPDDPSEASLTYVLNDQ